ncbi:diguanylate cyclase [Romboutsia maritimum]|uniref:Diguanylate cyclase n=1 Tax=Romboutsia maritimum TaxID=2020948 RepID=A0A371IT41_9FIRM|nr:diguanylate cyclase [Romboutsia maritimum]RDY23633.1 diguanylate cyclase [Romboutsia maritimum]
MNKINEKIDLFILGLFTFIFLVVGLVMLNINDSIKMNTFVMFGLMFFILMVTYLSSIQLGLIMSSITVFIYASYILYNNISYGIKVSLTSYIWIVGIPIATIITGNINKNIHELQKLNMKLTQEYKDLVSIDSETGLRNLKIFYNDVNKEISKAKRYNSKFSLMIIKLPYYYYLKKILGQTQTNEVMRNISNSITSFTRNEDIRYSLERDKIGILMPNTGNDGAQVVKERIKNEIRKLNLKLSDDGKSVNIDIKIAHLEYKSSMGDSIGFKNVVEEELQYDV